MSTRLITNYFGWWSLKQIDPICRPEAHPTPPSGLGRSKGRPGDSPPGPRAGEHLTTVHPAAPLHCASPEPHSRRFPATCNSRYEHCHQGRQYWLPTRTDQVRADLGTQDRIVMDFSCFIKGKTHAKTLQHLKPSMNHVTQFFSTWKTCKKGHTTSKPSCIDFFPCMRHIPLVTAKNPEKNHRSIASSEPSFAI